MSVDNDLDVSRWAIKMQAATTSKSEASHLEIDQDLEATIDALQTIAEHTKLCGRLIDYLAMIMHFCQFKNSAGMFDIRWWKTGRRIEPVLVRWQRTTSKQPRPTITHRFRKEMLKQSAIPEVRDELAKVIQLAREAIDLWKQCRGGLTNVKQARGFVQRSMVKDRIESIADQALNAHVEIQRTLEGLGYKLDRASKIEEVLAATINNQRQPKTTSDDQQQP